MAILEMQEKGEIQMLYDRWWKRSEETCVRDEKQKETTTRANSLVSLVLIVLLSAPKRSEILLSPTINESESELKH